ncbi:MAG: enoyl-CoA hydratase [Planctomycetes bacterium GWF2_50_10]|nr:MAG: enoyl-CoA hydratase [Planctomycetes bacterium GWF2_50_10]
MADVLLEKPVDGVAIVKLNRVEVKNALNLAVRQDLSLLFSELGADPSIRCIVLTGGDKVFAAGADIRDMADKGAIDMMLRNIHLLWQAIASCPKPVIAAVNGYAWGGGCELAMHADIIIAGESATFCQPEVKVGIMPGAGGTQRLTRAVGKFQAMKMILTGSPVSAREAFQMGLCSEVLPDDEVQGAALKMASQIAAMPPIAVMQMKEVLLAGQDMSLEAALILERKAFQLLFDTKDQKEGMKAFLEKRKPVYQGR